MTNILSRLKGTPTNRTPIERRPTPPPAPYVPWTTPSDGYPAPRDADGRTTSRAERLAGVHAIAAIRAKQAESTGDFEAWKAQFKAADPVAYLRRFGSDR